MSETKQTLKEFAAECRRNTERRDQSCRERGVQSPADLLRERGMTSYCRSLPAVSGGG